jgi:hypothetical protein
MLSEEDAAEQKKDPRELRRDRHRLVQKLKKIPRSHYIMTSRFNSENHSEMLNYCVRHGKIGCIYGSYCEISFTVMPNSIMFILEMNNDKNRIMGIGMVRNVLTEKRHSIYNEGSFNIYTYSGAKRIDRSAMTPDENDLIEELEKTCFKGKTHQKRCRGITLFPLDVLEKQKPKKDITALIRKMFLDRL